MTREDKVRLLQTLKLSPSQCKFHFLTYAGWFQDFSAVRRHCLKSRLTSVGDPVDKMEGIDASSFKKVQDLIDKYREVCLVGIVSEKHVS